MFTGIIERSLPLLSSTDGPGFRRLTLPNPWPDAKLGDSIALNGVCLTVAEITPLPPSSPSSILHPPSSSPPTSLAFDAIPETLKLTNLGLLAAGDPVHVERALRAGDRMDGHFVQGHVDATASLLEQITHHNEFRLKLETPPHLAKYLIPKGSVTLDGVSLTIASLSPTTFDVALIPTTLNITSLGQRPPGWPFNLECDILSKTIVTYLERMKGAIP
jgi:riboflavin synthase